MVKLIFLTCLIVFSNLSYAFDSIEEKICNAYQDEDSRKKCFEEFASSKKEDSPSTKPEIKPLPDNSANIKDLAKTFAVIEMAFSGPYTALQIKEKMDSAMRLYNVPLTIENYNRCSSSLISMRKFGGFSEMQILDYMVRMHSQESILDFPTAAATATTLMMN